MAAYIWKVNQRLIEKMATSQNNDTCSFFITKILSQIQGDYLSSRVPIDCQ